MDYKIDGLPFINYNLFAIIMHRERKLWVLEVTEVS